MLLAEPAVMILTPFFQSRFLPYVAAALICSLLALTSLLWRPLFPVDETRYVTVAWEMFSRHDWLLPTLNLEPYHHKPPLLFWLIMGLWSLFGVSQQVAMAAPYLIAFALCGGLIRLGTVLAPHQLTLPFHALLLLAGSLPFALYSHLIMFDMLLSVFVLMGLLAIWQFFQTGQSRLILLLGAAIGLGLLAKGPVILLHLLWPAALVRLWAGPVADPKRWGLFVLGGVVLGVMVGLLWAIPAALHGGPDFTEKIFWGQTAGRMANSFDHDRAIWWYFPFLPLLAMPWISYTGVWRGLRRLSLDRASPDGIAVRFLLSWIVPVFLSFSLISGKQIHYLLPLVPGFMLLAALALQKSGGTMKFSSLLPVLGSVALLVLLPGIARWAIPFLPVSTADEIHLPQVLEKLSLPVSLLGIAAIGILILVGRKLALTGQLVIVATAMLIFVSSLQYQASRGFYANYDLRPLAEVIARLPSAPLAFVRNYHGEWGFLARLERPVKQLDYGELQAWFEKNPGGIAFIRTRRPEEIAPFDVVFSMPYKMTNTYAILAPHGRGIPLRRQSGLITE